MAAIIRLLRMKCCAFAHKRQARPAICRRWRRNGASIDEATRRPSRGESGHCARRGETLTQALQ